jgi:Immunity protein 8
MKARYVGCDSPDILDLADCPVISNGEFCIYLSFAVGAAGRNGANQFGLLVCSPSWLESNDQGAFFVGRHTLIVKKFDFKKIEHFFIDYVSRCEGETWEEIELLIGRIAKSEFEDYNLGEKFFPQVPNDY